MASKSPDEIRKGITDRIVAAINKGTPPWRQPWVADKNAGPPSNFSTKRRYTGINPLLLWVASDIHGYRSMHWGTSNSWLKTVGAHVKRGQSATFVTLFRMFPKRDPKTKQVERDAKGKEKMLMLLREYPVFNVEQVQAPAVDVLLDGRGPRGIIKALLGDESRTVRSAVTTKAELIKIAADYLPAAQQPKANLTRERLAQIIHEGIEASIDAYRVQEVVLNTDPDFAPAEELLAKSGAIIKHGGDKAFYTHGSLTEYIQLPHKRQFEEIAAYYQTAAHELIHWVVNGKRIEYTGDRDYAFFELVAEIGACFTLNALRVPLADKMIDKSQSYLSIWLAKMGGDSKYLTDAASLAGRAADYLLTTVGKENPAYEEADTDEPPSNMAA